MYLSDFINKKPALKRSLAFLFVLFIIPVFSQQTKKEVNYKSVYAKEYKQVKKEPYNVKLLSLSETTPEKKWNNYHGEAINTTDSLYHFNNELLCFSFPTNSNKINNDYLIYYFSLKEASCPTLFSLFKYYKPSIDSNLIINSLPKELALLPAVCSAFNPNSSNGLGGVGFWHLNYPQAIKYGLTVNEFIDERKDFEKSTKAATLYIKDLYNMYNDWELTLSAYSCGVTTVNKYLKRSDEKTYQAIFPYLPEQTRDLVQAFVAMNYIYAYDNYGAVEINPVIKCDTILIERKLMFKAINDVIKIDLKELAFLNTTLNKDIFPDNYIALLPEGSKGKFMEFKDSIYFYQDSVLLKPKTKTTVIIPKDGEPITYKVRSGDVLGLIANRFNVRVSEIQDWNNLNGTRINIGQELTIYGKKKKGKTPKVSTEEKKDQPQLKKTNTNNSNQNKKYTKYTVKGGDNLWLIAKNYPGISADDIMDFNDINESLTIGQVLKIPKK